MTKKIINIIASFRNEEENIEYFCKKINQAFKKVISGQINRAVIKL